MESIIVILVVFIANFRRVPEEAVFMPVLLEMWISFFLIIYKQGENTRGFSRGMNRPYLLSICNKIKHNKILQ